MSAIGLMAAGRLSDFPQDKATVGYQGALEGER